MSSRLPVPALLAAVAFGCGGRQHVETADKRVRVHLEGNEAIDDDTLLGGLSLRRARAAGQGFDPYLVAVDEDRLRGYYLRHGFFRAEVRSQFDEKGDVVDVRFEIDEGPRAELARVEIAGLPDDPHVDVDALREQIRRVIPIADGETFDYEKYDDAKPQLLAPLERVGYAHARVEPSVAADRVRAEAIIRLEYEPGPLCEFGEVTLEGVEGELADAARARLRIHPGQRFSTLALEATQNALYEMGRFSVVRIESDRRDGDPTIPVTIEVAPQDPHELRLGGGVGVDPASYDVHTRAGYAIAGWPRPLVTTRFELRPAIVMLREDNEVDPRLEATVALERLDLLAPQLRAEAEVSLAYLAVEAYTTFGPRVRLGLRYPLLRREVQLAGGWEIRFLEFSDLDPAIDPATATELGLDEPYRLGFYWQSLVVDLRDDPVEPRRGFYGDLRVEEGTLGAGGEFTYTRVAPEVRLYAPLGRAVVAGRLGVGGIFGDLPITQRFFSGGASSHRGFPERRLATSITAEVDGEMHTTVIGGGAEVETGVELRAPLGTIKEDLVFGGVVFLDGGDVTERVADVDPMDLHWAVGAGLRLATVIGPIRFDVGYRLNRYGADEPLPGDRWAFHLSLGEAY